MKTWVFGDPWEPNAKHDIQYPLLFGMVEPSPISGTKEGFTILFTVCDREKTDRTNTLEVLSNTKQLVNDLLSYFKYEDFNDYFTIDENITPEPFVESFNDNCAGWSFSVTFNQPFEWDLCSVPYSGSPSALNPDYVQIVDQDNNVLAQLKVGTYTVTQLTTLLQDLSTTPTTTIIQDII